MSEAKMVQFTIDGRPLEAPAGTMVIRAAHEAGIDVPHFCYHPGLTPDGNCRMCLVEASNSRKPVASCVTPVAEGLEIQTDTEAVREAREGVLELMLLNHPLDCPICDKSGECMLQDNVYDHGPDHSRMQEPKVLKPTKDLGSKIALWGNRCIVCQRCTRFCDEISGTSELAIVHRGDSSVVDVFPGYPLENDLSMNTVDICPVGALISKDFLYEARVWNMKKTPSICTGCSLGCNVEVQQERNQTRRVVPRHNPEVNDYWMCDDGREIYRSAVAEDRLLDARLPVDPTAPAPRPTGIASMILEGLSAVIEKHGPSAVAGVASAFMTCEELFAFRRVFEGLRVEQIAAFTRPRGKKREFRRFTIPDDPNPNRRGAELILGAGATGSSLERLEATLHDGSIRAAVLVVDLPDWTLPSSWIERLIDLEFLAVFTLRDIEGLPANACVLPATTFGEKEGSMVNEAGRLQRLRIATQLPRNLRFEHEIFQQMQIELGLRSRLTPPSGLFRELVGEVWPRLDGKTLRDLGDSGLPTGSPHESAREEAVQG